MKILIIGEGGREHALAWKAAQSTLVTQVFVAPGNAGSAQEAKTTNIDFAIDDIGGLIRFARENDIDLCIVGPEGPLVLGISDAFNAAGIHCFGPSRAAARLEGSKAFAKDFLARHDIPSAKYTKFIDLKLAIDYVKLQSMPIVIKADGLAAGKGVIIAQTEDEAIAALEDMLDHSVFGEAGACVLIEEFLPGEEASFICMVANDKVLPLASSQDHKAAYDGDLGPNTGGMGAYTPAPVVDRVMHDRIMRSIIQPTIAGLQRDGLPYTGFLYAGVMIDAAGIPRVLEFNCRLGDPETQPILMRLESDLVELCVHAVEGRLPSKALWRDEVALGVVLAAEGYPASYEQGRVICFDESLSELENVKIFHAGTKFVHTGDSIAGDISSNAGRVLCVCALGASTAQAQALAYAAVELINWPGMWYRHDIGHRALARETD